MTDWTVDRLASLHIKQSRDGFRFGLDAVLLATDLPALPRQPKILELGAGQGTVSLAIAAQYPQAEIWSVERQSGMFELLEHNIASNGFDDRIHAFCRDLREFKTFLKQQSFDLVVSNPPFHKAGEGVPSPNEERAAAHAELHGGLVEFVEAARWCLKPRGRLKMVLPPRRLPDLCAATGPGDLGFERLRFVHPREQSPAYLFEAQLRRNSKDTLEVGSPLVVHVGDVFSDEVQRRLELR